MVEVIIDTLKKMLTALGLVCFTGFLFPSVFTIGESKFQSIVVLAFYTYCATSLFTYSRHKLFFVLSLPVLTQFIHIFQKYTFPTGANSLWRLLPFIILDIYLIIFLLRYKKDNGIQHHHIIVLWLITSTLFLVISPNLKDIIAGGIVLYIFTIPLVFYYLEIAMQANNYPHELEKYMCLLFIILGLGTFGLVYMGAGYKGSNNLLVTRNIADTNVTMAYFILLWPFVLLYCSNNNVSIWFKAGLIGIFSGVIMLSFSRGAMLLVLPYLFVTGLLIPNFINLKLLVAILFVGYVQQERIGNFIIGQDLLYFWQLRFADIGPFNNLFTKLEALSGRIEIQQTAYTLFKQRPLLGNGIGSFEVLGPGFREAHSLWYTLLSEQGIIGTVFIYSLLLKLLHSLITLTLTRNRMYSVHMIAFVCFLIFNHTVGSTLIILPAKSITVNCIAPLLLISMYFYSRKLNLRYSNLKQYETVQTPPYYKV
jgi:O-antigen ligase